MKILVLRSIIFTLWGEIMNKKIVVFGGGTGQSCLLSGLKKFPFDISAVVSVADDGKSTGMLRHDFNIPGVGDVRRVIVALSDTDSVVERLVNYRFDGNNSFSGHAMGNIILAALCNINDGSLSKGVKSISSLLKIKGSVLPFTDDYAVLTAVMEDGSVVEGESYITKCDKKIKSISYKNKPRVNNDVISAIKKCDAIVLSMGSLFTSLVCNLICDEVINAIDESKCKIIYVCNMMSQPGETDDYSVSDHVNLINSYLGRRKIDLVICNNGDIDEELIVKYATEEQKDPVVIDKDNIECDLIENDYVSICNNYIRNNSVKVAYDIYGYLIDVLK